MESVELIFLCQPKKYLIIPMNSSQNTCVLFVNLQVLHVIVLLNTEELALDFQR